MTDFMMKDGSNYIFPNQYNNELKKDFGNLYDNELGCFVLKYKNDISRIKKIIINNRIKKGKNIFNISINEILKMYMENRNLSIITNNKKLGKILEHCLFLEKYFPGMEDFDKIDIDMINNIIYQKMYSFECPLIMTMNNLDEFLLKNNKLTINSFLEVKNEGLIKIYYTENKTPDFYMSLDRSHTRFGRIDMMLFEVEDKGNIIRNLYNTNEQVKKTYNNTDNYIYHSELFDEELLLTGQTILERAINGCSIFFSSLIKDLKNMEVVI